MKDVVRFINLQDREFEVGLESCYRKLWFEVDITILKVNFPKGNLWDNYLWSFDLPPEIVIVP
jgi:hypothetical protein